MARGTARAKTATTRRWGFVCASARPWKTVEEPSLQNRGTPVPQQDDQGPRVPREPGQGRKTLGTSNPRVWLRHGGAVPVVLSKKGRNVGPQPPPILGTKLAELTPRHVVGLSQKRWAIARRNGERQAGLGLGEPHVSGSFR